MESFRIPNELARLSGPYPDATAVADAAKLGGEAARVSIARLWLSEGIPYAFKDCPGIYESVRTWLSSCLGIHAKEIGITGSAMLGASLAPSKLGNPFNNGSDLDLFAVSPQLFADLREDFRKWSYDYDRNACCPSNNREATFWKDNAVRGQRLIQKGFLDTKMVPNLPEYPVVKRISQSMWLLVEKLKATPNAPALSQASLRCYASWEAFVLQVSLSLNV